MENQQQKQLQQNNEQQIMMMTMGAQECDSFDQEDIDYLQAELLNLQGPSLSSLQSLIQNQPMISFGSIDIVKSLLHQQDKDIKFVGCDQNAQYKIFFYVLLLIGVQQHNNYPHLNTLIRQQFYKPNIFDDPTTKIDEIDQSQVMLEKCLNYFQQIDENVGTEEYILTQPLFEQACIIMLKNSVDKQETTSVYQQLANKFHIDMQILKSEKNSQCFKLGANNHFYIIKQQDYYFLVTIDFQQDINQIKVDDQSMGSEGSGDQAEVEPSDGSTPQFKNSEAKYHKKSHKNSFGGDLQVVQYRDLLHLQSQRLHRLSVSKNKVLSDYFDTNEVESCAQHIQEKQMDSNIINKGSFQDIIDNKKIGIKGSTIELTPELLSNFQRRQNRRISFSEIIECHDLNQIIHNQHVNHEKVKEEKQNSSHPQINSLSNKVVMEESSQPIRMRTSIIHNQQLQRIEERHSSQRQSTHPDQQNSDPSQNLEAINGDGDDLVRLKDRKYSCQTQQMTSIKAKTQKQIEPKNYVFNMPKNLHKNSEVITYSPHEQETMKQRFEENTIRFSEVDIPSQESNRAEKINKSHNSCMQLNSRIYSYEITNEPEGWLRKEIIYYFPNNQRQIIAINNPFPQLSKNSEKLISQMGKPKGPLPTTFASNITVKEVQKITYRNPFQEVSEASFETIKKYGGDYNKDSSFSQNNQQNGNKKNIQPPQKMTKPKIVFNYLPSKELQSLQHPKQSREMFAIKQPIYSLKNSISHQYGPSPLPFPINLQSQQKRPQTFGGSVTSDWGDSLQLGRR